MAMSLSNQVVLISGCSSGIGRALALELATRGQQVFASARKLDALADLSHPNLRKLSLDVTDDSSIATAIASVIQQAGRIDMLINNAGFTLIGPLAELPLDGVRQVFDTNLVGPVAMIQAVFPHLSRQRSGRIVNVGSVVGLLPTPFASVYCASKAAVHMLSEVLRMEVAPFGIDVIEVQPGAVRSSIADTASAGLGRYKQSSSSYQPVYEGIAKRAYASQDRPMDTARFAAHVADGLLTERAPRIVRSGRGARLYPALSRLPGSVRDRALSRQFGLAGWKGQAR